MGRLVVVVGGSPAKHKLGDIGRETDDFFVVHDERGDTLIGNWLYGFGMVEVEVERSHTRKLTYEEADHLHGSGRAIGSSACHILTVDPSEVEDGWQPKPKV